MRTRKKASDIPETDQWVIRCHLLICRRLLGSLNNGEGYRIARYIWVNDVFRVGARGASWGYVTTEVWGNGDGSEQGP